jgi:aminoglycoside phosphotransferase (APT) family kinase protein
VELLAAGRDCDVFDYGDGLVLRRHRDGRPATTEAALLDRLHGLGFPVPAMVSVDGPAIIMERIDGPHLAEAMLVGAMTLDEGADVLARLHDSLHALPWPGGEPLLHLDLHPLNVLVGPAGPIVIDWVNARPGRPGVDLAMTAILIAQTAVAPDLPGELAEPVRALLAAFAASVSEPYLGHLDEAVRLRRSDPSQTPEDHARLAAALDLAHAVHP